MSPRQTPLRRPEALIRMLVLFMVLLALVTPQARAQEATPQAGTPAPQPTAAATGTPATPTPTPTATLTPTPTATLTGLQARLGLAQTYLAGKDYDQAAALFAEIAEEDRGNAEALAGLKAALDGRAAAMATLAAPWPTAAPSPTAPAPVATVWDTLGANLRDFVGAALAGLLLIVLIYLLAHAVRWLLYGLRELWLMRIMPLFGRPAVRPGFLIGAFANEMPDLAPNAPLAVTFALTEKLLAWNQVIQSAETPIEPAPSLELGGMGWLKVLWSWVLPPSRNFRVTGALQQGTAGVYRLAVQRTALSSNRIDRSTTFETIAPTAEEACRTMAGEAAKWLISPEEIEAGQVVAGSLAAAKAAGEPKVLTASEIVDQAVALLLPVRQQVNQGAINFSDARQRLQKVEGLLAQLPESSSLRADLLAAVTDLRRSVPAG